MAGKKIVAGWAGRVLTAAGWARRELYHTGFLGSAGAGVPVISVGATSCGGSGKTPVVAEVAQRLQTWGIRVGVVASGYRGAAGPLVAVVAPDRSCGWWFGDEAAWLAGRLPAAIVVRGRDKLRAARLAVSHGAEVVVVDDGFQHQRLQRDLDIVLGSRVLERHGGSVWQREPAASARLADLRWWHVRHGALLVTRPIIRGFVGRPVAEPLPARWSAPWVVSLNIAESIVDAVGSRQGTAQDLRGKRVAVAAGVALPQDFVQLIERCGARVVASRFVGDHHPISRRDLRALRGASADLVLCTEKDLLRDRGQLAQSGVLALRCRLTLVDGGEVLDRLLRRTLGIEPASCSTVGGRVRAAIADAHGAVCEAASAQERRPC